MQTSFSGSLRRVEVIQRSQHQFRQGWVNVHPYRDRCDVACGCHGVDDLLHEPRPAAKAEERAVEQGVVVEIGEAEEHPRGRAAALIPVGLDR